MTPCRVTTSQRSVVVSVPQKNAYMAFKAASSELEHPHFSECQFEWIASLPITASDDQVLTKEPSLQALASEVRSLTDELVVRAAQCSAELAELRCSHELLLEELDEWKAENERLRAEIEALKAMPRAALPADDPWWTDPRNQAPHYSMRMHRQPVPVNESTVGGRE